ncbi:MAG: hypothetical protein JW892_09955 [Anaerolineae bacterium]|nr:hypothetical protein [Anaerolineae bacterium]
MRTRIGDEYILLEDSGAETALLPVQQQPLEAALFATLQAPSLRDAPSPAFVAALQRELVLAVKRRQRALHWLGAAGGGVLSLIGGVLVWYLWRRQGARPIAPRGLVFPARSAPLWRRQPA